MPIIKKIDLVDCSNHKHKIEKQIEHNARERKPKQIRKVNKNGGHTGTGMQGTKGVDKTTGTHFDSIWEYAFFRYEKDIMAHVVSRNKDYYFEYRNDHNELKKFYPDFIVNGSYYEIKGIFRANDLCKKNATLGRVKFLDGEDIKPIMKELNKMIPNWRDDFQKDVFTRREKYGKIKVK